MSVISLNRRLKRAEERAGGADEVERILDALDVYPNVHQVTAIMVRLQAHLHEQLVEAGGEDDWSLDTAFLSTPIHNRARCEAVLATIPNGEAVFWRLVAAFERRCGITTT